MDLIRSSIFERQKKSMKRRWGIGKRDVAQGEKEKREKQEKKKENDPTKKITENRTKATNVDVVVLRFSLNQQGFSFFFLLLSKESIATGWSFLFSFCICIFTILFRSVSKKKGKEKISGQTRAFAHISLQKRPSIRHYIEFDISKQNKRSSLVFASSTFNWRGLIKKKKRRDLSWVKVNSCLRV